MPESDLLRGARVYLSGPMDFVSDRKDEMDRGWRRRVSDVLESYGATVFNPWHKPEVRGLGEYGREGEKTDEYRKRWTFDDNAPGARRRAELSGKFWPTMHIDLRMVDTSDFLISYCPTNVYSVGTPHEIVVARQQKKPVLLVSPPVELRSLTQLKRHLKRQGDQEALELLDKLMDDEIPVKQDFKGVPSLWYMALIDTESFFDGFGYAAYRQDFGWDAIPADDLERRRRPNRPLLPFLERLASGVHPQKWNRSPGRWQINEDWMLWEAKKAGEGLEVQRPRPQRRPAKRKPVRRRSARRSSS